MDNANLKWLLFGILLILFALVFDRASTGLGGFTLGIAFLGLLSGIYGAFLRRGPGN